VYPLDLGLIVETKVLWDELQSVISELPVRVVLEQSDGGDWALLTEKIDRMRPDVILLDLVNFRERLDEFVQAVRATSASPYIFALHTAQDPELILKAMRAGITEYLFPPFGDQLRHALERVSAERSRKQHSVRPGGRVVGFVSAKGGCGATTLACHTAVQLAARTGQKVLLADFDLDSGIVGFLLKTKSPYSVLDAFRNVQRLDANYWNALISNGIPNLEVLSSPPPPTAAHSVTVEQIRYVLRFARTQYDWLAIDLGRSLTDFSFRTVEELDELYLVTTLEVPALHRAKQIIKRLLDGGYGAARLRVLLNRAPKRADVTLDEVKNLLGAPVYAVFGEDGAALDEAYSEGKLAAPGSAIGRQVDDLAVKIAGIDSGKTKKKFSFF
jgi:pilus assembly protein CpaE